MKTLIHAALITVAFFATFAVQPADCLAKSPADKMMTFDEAAILVLEWQLNEDEIFDMYLAGLIDEPTAMILMDLDDFEQTSKVSGMDLGSGRIKGVSGLDLGSGRFQELSGTDLGSGR
ncbi:hypothetical protein [Rubinisphaera margarita]|uniref:hypothetical protein n=1 Tax=Rubinisphaera margarita TaxID=2909586 RepID=UPI001EE9414E|nr:hypothetical protein [Rubinisphaera margarita]MCG6156899.1 hypothetical protein [Rubinisphaera margarita]